jgi:ligand-binding sensor domain-containing protein/anti-sigma regulatory factor (Ser/Thr protein kinase)
MNTQATTLMRVLCCLPVFACMVNAVWAQAPVFRNYTSADGLPSSETYCALQDRNGYMWFGTDRGIVRFDGYTFQPYTEGLTDHSVFSLMEDRKGRIWYHTYSGSIGYLYKDSSYAYRYNSTSNRGYKSLPEGEGMFINFNGLKHSSLIYIDSAGHTDLSLNADDTTHRVIYLPEHNDRVFLVSGLNKSNYARVVALPDHKILGEFRLNKKIIPGIPSPVYLRQRNGIIWLWINGELMMLKDGAWTIIARSKDRVLSMAEDTRGNIWVGYQYKGVALFEAQTQYGHSTRFLPAYSVSGMCSDREGGMWFTTLENGIYYLPPFTGFAYDKRHGLPVAKTERIININGNAVMLLSDKSVFVKRAGSNGNVECLHKSDSKLVQDIRYEAPGHLYYSTYGITPGTASGNEVAFALGPKPVFVSTKKVHVGARYVWGTMGTLLTRIEKENGHVLERFYLDSIAVLTCAFEQQNGNVLAGTLRGLYMLDKRRWVSLETRHPLLGCRIADIRRIDSTHLAIATIGQGLLIVKEGSYDTVVQYAVQDGLPGLMCHVLLPEGDSVLWAGTNRGLCRVSTPLDKSRATVRTADIHDGIISNEIYDICMIGKDLWLATAGGVSVFPREYMLRPVQEIPVHIGQVLVNGQPVDKEQPGSFPYNHHNISISFAGLSYQYAERLLYTYRLKGSGNQWSTTQSRSVIFNTLPPGDYVFEFKVIAPARQESMATGVYAFTIHPAFWQTWWFRLLCALLCVGGITLYVQRKVRAVRTQALLTSELNRFRDKALRDQMNPHFIYNSLNSIQSYILKNDIRTSASFLSKFSRLMRLTFSHTSMERVSLDKDIEALELYAELENLGFREKFMFHIDCDLPVERAAILVPPLILQPFVENAILHGLLAKNGPGIIRLNLAGNDGKLSVSISDNGIGREQAAVLREKKTRYHEGLPAGVKRSSSGMAATLERIEQCWGKHPGNAQFTITDLYDKQGNAAGTIVHFYLPLIYD